jgi:hypothetical protein
MLSREEGTFENGASLLAMDGDPHQIDARVPQQEISGEEKTDDSVWTHLPIVVSAAVICLLLFLFLSCRTRARQKRSPWSGDGCDAGKRGIHRAPEGQEPAALGLGKRGIF